MLSEGIKSLYERYSCPGGIKFLETLLMIAIFPHLHTSNSAVIRLLSVVLSKDVTWWITTNCTAIWAYCNLWKLKGWTWQWSHPAPISLTSFLSWRPRVWCLVIDLIGHRASVPMNLVFSYDLGIFLYDRGGPFDLQRRVFFSVPNPNKTFFPLWIYFFLYVVRRNFYFCLLNKLGGKPSPLLKNLAPPWVFKCLVHTWYTCGTLLIE